MSVTTQNCAAYCMIYRFHAVMGIDLRCLLAQYYANRRFVLRTCVMQHLFVLAIALKLMQYRRDSHKTIQKIDVYLLRQGWLKKALSEKGRKYDQLMSYLDSSSERGPHSFSIFYRLRGV